MLFVYNSVNITDIFGAEPDALKYTVTMKKNNQFEAATLRKKAEDLLIKNPSDRPRGRRLDKSLSLSDNENQKLFHELEVHQIELEMQNEELVNALSAAKDAIDLYDFAPCGYFTLSKEGRIIRLNLTGAQMLGKNRPRVKDSSFGFYVSDDTKPAFNLFLEKVFNNKFRENCEVTLLINGKPMCVYLSGVFTEKGEQCLVTMVDITERKRMEIALQEKISEMSNFHHLVVGREIRMIELKKEINELLVKSGREEKYIIVE
jgi:PAS domain-containing protein